MSVFDVLCMLCMSFRVELLALHRGEVPGLPEGDGIAGILGAARTAIATASYRSYSYGYSL